MRRSDVNVGNSNIGHLSISGWSELAVWEPELHSHGDSSTARGDEVRIIASYALSFIKYLTAKGFQLTRRKNGFAIRHSCTLVDVKDAGPMVSHNIGTSFRKMEIPYCVIINAI